MQNKRKQRDREQHQRLQRRQQQLDKQHQLHRQRQHRHQEHLSQLICNHEFFIAEITHNFSIPNSQFPIDIIPIRNSSALINVNECLCTIRGKRGRRRVGRTGQGRTGQLRKRSWRGSEGEKESGREVMDSIGL
jgi:hypothetical protein